MLFQIGTYLKQNKSGKIFHLPFDVRLSFNTNKHTSKIIDTIVQPDLTIITDPSILDDLGCNGTPPWIIEILSFSEHMNKKDITTKFQLYQDAGVREYWVVHPTDGTVIPFRLDADASFQPIRNRPFAKGEKVPVGVFSDLEVDLEEVFGG